LEKATVSAQDLAFLIPGEATKRRRAVNDGAVVTTDVGNYKRTSEINGTEDYCRMWPSDDPGQEGKYIKA